MKIKDDKQNAYLVGPFFGELYWEYFRFAPYIIYLKKIHSDCKFIISTRPERFDLYGVYCNLFVPLKLQYKSSYRENAFKLSGFPTEYSDGMIKLLYENYSQRYKIIDHIYPIISDYRYNIKWQFPRIKMDYDFRPRCANKILVDSLFDNNNIVITDNNIDYVSNTYNIIKLEEIKKLVRKEKNISYLGCLIELIKKCKFTISTINTDLGRLSLLLKKPLIYMDRDIDNDNLSLLNPYKTLVVDCKNLQNGIEIYENSI